MAKPPTHQEIENQMLGAIQSTKALYESHECSAAEYAATLLKFSNFLSSRGHTEPNESSPDVPPLAVKASA